jgi:hypothetical protein
MSIPATITQHYTGDPSHHSEIRKGRKMHELNADEDVGKRNTSTLLMECTLVPSVWKAI